MEYSVITKRQLKCSFDSVEDCLFSYPKIVFLDNLRVKVVDLNDFGLGVNSNKGDYEFDLQCGVINKILNNNLLWLLIETGNILVINVETGGKLNLNQNYYKLQHILIENEEILVTTQVGEYLVIKHSYKDILDKMLSGIDDMELKVERKVEKPHFKLKDRLISAVHGLCVSIANGEVAIKCPYTGLKVMLCTPKSNDFKFIASWDELLVLSNEKEIQLLDISNLNIPYKCESNMLNIYPLQSHDNYFFYIINNDGNMLINCIVRVSKEDANSNIVKDCGTINHQITQSQDTLKSLASCLKEEIIISKDQEQHEGKLQKLLEIFSQIKDIVFIINVVTNLAHHSIISKPLIHFVQSLHNIDDSNLVHMIYDYIIKVDIIKYLLLKNNNDYDPVKIFELTFTELNIYFLSNSEFDLATICWLKFSEFNVSFMTAHDLMNIFNSVPLNTKLSVLIIWLKSILIPLLRVNPFFVDVFVRWITERTFLLEKSANWPKIGLKFVTELMSVLDISMPDLCVRPLSIDDLSTLKFRITQIMELKDKFKINIMLAELSCQNPTEVALIMIHRCYTEDLSAFLKEYLPRFSIRYSIELDEILRVYIETEASSGGGNIEAQRLTILLEAFKVQNIKLNSLLSVLRALEVPWDRVIYDLAKKVSIAGDTDFTFTDSDRIVAQNICDELKFANVKVVLKKYNFPLGIHNYMSVKVLYSLISKIIESTKVDVDDLKVITDFNVSCKIYGYVSYIDRCLRDCNTSNAKKFFNCLNKKETKLILKALISKYEFLISDDLTTSATERSYLDFFKTTHADCLDVEALEIMYHLKYSYQTKTALNTVHCEECPEYPSSRTEFGTDSVINKLMKGVRHTQCATLINLLHQTATTSDVRKFVENIIQYVYDNNIERSKISSLFSLFIDGKNKFTLLESCKIFTQLVTAASEEHIHTLSNILSIFNSIVNTSITIKNLRMTWKFNYVFLPISSTNAFNYLLNFFTGLVANNNNPLQIETLKDKTNTNNELIQLRIFNRLLDNQEKKLPILDLIEHRENIVNKLVPKLVTAEEIDELLLTSLLLLFNNNHSGSYDDDSLIDLLRGSNDNIPIKLTSYLSNPHIRKIFSISNILTRNAITYSPQYILRSKHNLNILDVAMPDITEETCDAKLVLFSVLMQHSDMDIDRIIELCNTLNVPLDDGLSLQLIAVMHTWDLKFTLVDDCLGRKRICYNKNENKLLDRCTVIWESIEDKTFIKGILHDFMKNGEVSLHGKLISVNSYHYEVYLCILKFIFGSPDNLKQIKEYFLLHFLTEYTRYSSPKQYEFEQFSVKGMFPELGNYRLPFHLFTRDDMWSNLKSEITLETYERWLPVVALLSLDSDLQTAKDMICSNALKQTMTSAQKTIGSLGVTEEKESWALSSRGEPLLRAAHKCVGNIANMEWAGACLFYVLQGCARGADQVAAAQLCFQFAQRWDTLQPGNRAVRQMQRLHSTLSTQHALHKIDWATEDLLRLSVEPVQLIRNMYLHPDFPDKMASHDINEAANEIADKNGINISSMRIQIIEHILDHDTKSSEFVSLDSKTLLTAKYILNATSSKMAAIYLSRIAFDDEINYNKRKKLRALQCFMSIVEPDTALKVTKRDRKMLWENLQDLYFAINLELNEQPWAVDMFNSNKVVAIKQLCDTVETNRNTHLIKLIGNISLKYGKPTEYTKVMTLLLRAGLYDDLIPFLLQSLSAPVDVISNAWRVVLVAPFKIADYPLTDKQKIACLRVVNLLPVCPVICDEDLKEIWNNCIRCKCYGIGCLVLPYMSHELRTNLKELRKIDRRNLIVSIKNLNSETYLVSGVLGALENMLPKLNR